MTGFGWTPRHSEAIHDDLYGRALVLENGVARLCILTADLLGVPVSLSDRLRDAVASVIGTDKKSVLFNCSHTHGGPHTGVSTVGEPDTHYLYFLTQKLIGAALQASRNLVPAHLTYGETSAQIGVNRRLTLPDGKTILAPNYRGAVLPTVQNLIVNRADGKTMAMLFSHACHPTTIGAGNREITGDWPGAAVSHLKRRFQKEGAESGVLEDAIPFFLQGCSGDIDPARRGDWEAMRENGEQIAEAAHAARWNAHGRLDETLFANEAKLALPVIEGDRSDTPFELQRLDLGGVSLIGFPAEIFAQTALDLRELSPASAFYLGNTNGCLGYLGSAEEFQRGGYEIEEAHKYYGAPQFSPEAEFFLRAAVTELMNIGR